LLVRVGSIPLVRFLNCEVPVNLQFALQWLWGCCDALVYVRSFREERASENGKQAAKMKITHIIATSTVFAGATLGSAATNGR
jgi:hypothetical protein